MKKTVQIKYSDFVEVLDVEMIGSELRVSLSEIVDKPQIGENNITLDFATDIREEYSIFPFESGDLSIIQIKNVFILSCHVGEKIHWVRFDSSQLISYLLKQDLTKSILPYINEDEHIFLNSVLSDFVRTDYSFSSLNKKVKFVKIAVLMNFVKDLLKMDFERVLLDETVLGDVEIENISLAFKYAEKKFLRLIKIDNLVKVILALEKENQIPTKFKFSAKSLLINLGDNTNKFDLKFEGQRSKYDYQVLPQKNYVFDLGDKEYALSTGDYRNILVSGKVFVFNGDERDLLIN